MTRELTRLSALGIAIFAIVMFVIAGITATQNVGICGSVISPDNTTAQHRNNVGRISGYARGDAIERCESHRSNQATRMYTFGGIGITALIAAGFLGIMTFQQQHAGGPPYAHAPTPNPPHTTQPQPDHADAQQQHQTSTQPTHPNPHATTPESHA